MVYVWIKRLINFKIRFFFGVLVIWVGSVCFVEVNLICVWFVVVGIVIDIERGRCLVRG